MKRLILTLLVLATLWSVASAQLKIYCLDVNQGDATLIIAPTGESLLVDAGKEEDAKKIVEVLTLEHITEITYVVVTHFDGDHLLGLRHLKLNAITFGHPILTNGSDPKDYSSDVNPNMAIAPGDSFKLGTEVTVRCLAAERKVLGGSSSAAEGGGSDADNANSVALIVAYQGFEFFVAGDLTAKVEKVLVDAGTVPDVDVYHASHHGAKTGNSEELVEALAPEVSIISCGTTYNHPNKTVIERLRDNESVIYQTNKNTNKRKWTEPIKNVAASRIGDVVPTKDKGSILIFVKDGKYTVSLERKEYKSGVSYPVEVLE